MHQRAILHLDMDAFFVGVERLKDPTLVGQPVVVGGSPTGRGVVAAASYEARMYGIHSAMPMAEAVRRCRDLVIVRGAFTDYIACSRQVRARLERVIPVVEQASVDEFYGDLTGTERLYGSAEARVVQLLDAIRQETGLPCSAALATNKLVAKVATQWAKPNGFWVVPPGEEARQFAPLPIGALPGIGPVTQARLEQAGIQTLGELAAMEEERLRYLFGRHGPGLAARAQGISESPVEPGSEAKSVGHEITFSRDITAAEELKSMLWQLAAQVGHKLRLERVTARTLTLKLRWADFKTLTRGVTLPLGVNGDYDIARLAEDLFNKVYRAGAPVRLIGVRASGLLHWCEQQLLFEAATQEHDRSMYAALDAIRDRFGFGAIGSARALGASRTPARPADQPSLFALGSKQAVERALAAADPGPANGITGELARMPHHDHATLATAR